MKEISFQTRARAAPPASKTDALRGSQRQEQEPAAAPPPATEYLMRRPAAPPHRVPGVSCWVTASRWLDGLGEYLGLIVRT